MKFTFAPESQPLEGYTIKRAVHRGGFGEVYYALSDAGKEVALKLLNNNLDVELRGVSQCLNLKHQNLVTIFDIRQDKDGDHWVIMEFVSGRGLYDTIQGYPNGMPLEEVRLWMDGISGGLGFLHDRGIVHRDLKPANVFRDHEGVKVGDVGLSKYISESRRSAQTQSVGTVYYMAPEVAKGRYGREVDVYACGIMLYEMLTGRVPFEGQTTAEILMKHLTSEPDVTVLPEKLQPVLRSALDKDPDQRTHTVDELRRQFIQATAGEDESAPVLVRKRTQPYADIPASAQPMSAQPAAAAAAGKFEADSRGRTQLDHHAAATKVQQTEMQSAWASIRNFWVSLPTPVQWVLGGVLFLLIIESNLLGFVAVGGMLGGTAYLVYQIFRAFTGQTDSASSKPTRPTAAAAPAGVMASASGDLNQPVDRFAKTVTPPKATPRPVEYTPATLREIPKSQRATDLFTSMTVSLAAVMLVTIAIYCATNALQDASQAIYFAAITMLGAWGLLTPAKFWEGKRGDTVLRRLTLGLIGAGVGYVAYLLPQYLMIADQLDTTGAKGVVVSVGRLTLSDGSSLPTRECFMLFFAGLFVFRRWWWQADSFRRSRFRISSALLSLFVGIVLSGILADFAFPTGLGALWALGISSVVQLSSGWTPPENRELIRPARSSSPNHRATEAAVVA